MSEKKELSYIVVSKRDRMVAFFESDPFPPMVKGGLRSSSEEPTDVRLKKYLEGRVNKDDHSETDLIVLVKHPERNAWVELLISIEDWKKVHLEGGD